MNTHNMIKNDIDIVIHSDPYYTKGLIIKENI